MHDDDWRTHLNYRDAHFSRRRADDDGRTFFVMAMSAIMAVISAFRNQPSGRGEEDGNTEQG